MESDIQSPQFQYIKSLNLTHLGMIICSVLDEDEVSIKAWQTFYFGHHTLNDAMNSNICCYFNILYS
jgi:hypothetical protein